MRARRLAQFEVQPLAFGGNVFGWTADEATSFRLLDAFVDAGQNLIDTADVYSRWVPGHTGGESETVLGRWLKKSGKRDKVVIATKVGFDMGGDDKGLSSAYIKKAVDRSLKRLQIDTIDLYQSHTDDESTPLEETLGAYADLLKAGKIRAIGASNYTAARLTEALAVSRKNNLPAYTCLQPHYSLIERAPYEAALEAVCVREKLSVIAYFSLASGFLTGKYRSKADIAGKERGSRVEKYLNVRGFRILAALDDISARRKSKPTMVALAWLMARPSITAPIASATNVAQFADLVAATRLELDDKAIEQLDAASIDER